MSSPFKLQRWAAGWALAGILAVACGDSMSGPEDTAEFASESSDLRVKDMVAVSALTQTGLPGEEVGDPPTVRFLDADGDPVYNVLVRFDILSGGGSMSATLARSDREGYASVAWTLGSTAGATNVLRFYVRNWHEPIDFQATALAVEAESIEKVGGDDQTGAEGEELAEVLEVRVVDVSGDPVGGYPLSWRVVSGGGSIEEVDGATNSAGIARASWTLGATGEDQRAVAENGTLASAPFEASIGVEEPGDAYVEITPSSVSFDALGQTRALTATAYDGDGEPMSADITWRTLSSTIATVNASGTVESGGNGTTTIIGAMADGYADTVVVAVQQEAATLTVEPSSADIMTSETIDLNAMAFDSNGHPVTGVSLQWNSDAQAVAGVDGVGVVTGLSTGTAPIRASGAGLVATAQVTVSEPEDSEPPPAPGGLLFSSDWASSRGTSNNALTDGGKWDILSDGGGKEVISSSGFDFPSANVLRVVHESTSSIRIYNRSLPVPAVGENRFYRWYVRVTMPDNLSDNSTHPIEPHNANPWAFVVENSPNRGLPSGHFGIWFKSTGESTPNHRWYLGGNQANLIALDKNVTYRIEYHFHRVGTGTYRQSARIYDSSDNLIYDASDFNNYNGSVSMASNPVLDIATLSGLSAFQVGSNGLAGSGPFPFTYGYQGAICIRSDTWCGRYNGGI